MEHSTPVTNFRIAVTDHLTGPFLAFRQSGNFGGE
jgi:hypothetical protein